MRKHLALIGLIFLAETQYISASQPTVPILRRVENPELYDSLARNNEFLKGLFKDWKIISTSTAPYATSDTVSINLNLEVPTGVIPNSTALEISLSLKFAGQKLLNIKEIESFRMGLATELENIELNKFVRTFRCNSNIKTEFLYWGIGGTKYQVRSDNGDTLEIIAGWPTSPASGRISWFCFNSTKILEVLEIYLDNLFPIPKILYFRDKVGLGHAKKMGSILQISSGLDCTGTNSCMRIYHSFQLINAYKLALSTDWEDFPYVEDAIRELDYLNFTEPDKDCFSASELLQKSFIIMCNQQNTLPRRVFIVFSCINGQQKIFSVVVDGKGTHDPSPRLLDLSKLDSLIPELRWNEF